MPVNKHDSFKSVEIAEATRTDGNKCYVEKNFFDALLKYNESLCYAVPDSEAVGLAYANRSAVYYEMKLYAKSLKNIELARANGYPKKNLSILDKRAEKCQQQLVTRNEVNGDENIFDFIKLSHEANPKVPFVANCLELKRSEKYGRFIITNEDLKVGDIVAVEPPHFKIIKTDSRYESCEETNRYQRCVFCLKDNLMDLIPCEICSSTMFCSEECLIKAQNDFHFFECPIIDLLLKSGIMQMAMRTFFQALSMFDGSIDALENFLKKNENLSASVYDFNFNDTDDRLTAKNYLLSLYCLARSDNVCLNDSPENILKVHPLKSGLWKSHEDFIVKFVRRILQVGDSNFHGICGWSIKKYENQFPQMIGIGCYPFISLVNHSCAPNVNRIYVEDKMILLVERPIAKGEQLYDCYKTTFYTQPRRERQEVLLNEYYFSCDCIACSNDFPIFQRLKSFDKKIYKIAKKGKDELSKLDVDHAKKRFKEYCDIIQKHHKQAFPSSEIVVLQECILQCVSIVIKPKFVFP
ncbi:CLUMA_CG003674, isoform A [Clunio marinus]|uniref:CLUMA_CG003674, isoform A n=1 Tax=Clunio marinus TaxID=568069 RepID=A0A1J1HUV7_9DIPT|nr:CLUMA_CG003674, isoform A [Clunio marinus]